MLRLSRPGRPGSGRATGARVCRACLSTSTRISRVSMEAAWAEATPSIRSRRRATSSSISFFSSAAGRLPVMPQKMTGHLAHVELDDERIARPPRAGSSCRARSGRAGPGRRSRGWCPIRTRPGASEVPSEVVRGDLLDPVDRADDLLQRPGDGVFDVLRRGAPVAGDDGDGRELEVGEEVRAPAG